VPGKKGTTNVGASYYFLAHNTPLMDVLREARGFSFSSPAGKGSKRGGVGGRTPGVGESDGAGGGGEEKTREEGEEGEEMKAKRARPSPPSEAAVAAIIAAVPFLPSDTQRQLEKNKMVIANVGNALRGYYGKGKKGRAKYMDESGLMVPTLTQLEEIIHLVDGGEERLEFSLAHCTSASAHRRLHAVRLCLRRITKKPATYLLEDELTLAKPLKTTRGSRPLRTLKDLKEYEVKCMARMRVAVMDHIEGEVALHAHGGSTLSPLLVMMTLYTYFGGLAKEQFAAHTRLGRLGSYDWCRRMTIELSAHYVKHILTPYLQKATSSSWVMLCLADNYVKLSKNTVKTAGQPLMNAVPTIMYVS
jgi:hypothetical protein